MPWSTISGNQGVTFANLKDAVDTGVLTARIPVPTNNELVTKEQANQYVNINTTVTSYQVKAINQIVVKQDLAALAGVCVSNCMLIIRNESTVNKTITFFSAGDGTCRGDYNFTLPDLGTNTESTYVNSWRSGAMPFTVTVTTDSLIVIEYSVNGGTNYTTVETLTVSANTSTTVQSVSIPNVAGYRLRVRLINTEPPLINGTRIDGSYTAGFPTEYRVYKFMSKNGIMTGGITSVAVNSTTCNLRIASCCFSSLDRFHVFVTRSSGTFTPTNPFSSVLEFYYTEALNSCGQTGTLASDYSKLVTGYTPISVQARVLGSDYVDATTCDVSINLQAPNGTLRVEYDLIRYGITFYQNLVPFIHNSATCSFVGTLTLRPGDQIKIRLKTATGGLVSFIPGADTSVCPSSGVPTCEWIYTVNATTDLAFRPQVSFGAYTGCL